MYDITVGKTDKETHQYLLDTSLTDIIYIILKYHLTTTDLEYLNYIVNDVKAIWEDEKIDVKDLLPLISLLTNVGGFAQSIYLKKYKIANFDYEELKPLIKIVSCHLISNNLKVPKEKSFEILQIFLKLYDPIFKISFGIGRKVVDNLGNLITKCCKKNNEEEFTNINTNTIESIRLVNGILESNISNNALKSATLSRVVSKKSKQTSKQKSEKENSKANSCVIDENDLSSNESNCNIENIVYDTITIHQKSDDEEDKKKKKIKKSGVGNSFMKEVDKSLGETNKES
jgi:hypothetical protein